MEDGKQRGQLWVGRTGGVRTRSSMGVAGRVQRRERTVGDERPQNREAGVGWVIGVLGRPRVKSGLQWGGLNLIPGETADGAVSEPQQRIMQI